MDMKKKTLESNKPNETNNTNLKIFHMNIDKSDNYLTERINSIIYNIQLLNPDIICLHEIKSSIYQNIIQSLENYVGFQVFNTNKEDYGSCIFISKEIKIIYKMILEF